MNPGFLLMLWSIWAVSMMVFMPTDRVTEKTLQDGTRCVAYRGSIDCDWKKL